MRLRLGFCRAASLAVAFIAIVLCNGAAEAKRVALVIGNNTYRNVSALTNPANDANDVATTLGRLGFQVRKVTNGTFDDMRKALLEFNRNARGAEIALVFFAGHGIEVGGENWLIPIDAELKSDIDVDHEAIGLKALLPSIETASQLGLVILDACRNNPFSAKMQRTIRTRSVSRGLAGVEPTGNVLVAFAAKEGTTAADGEGRNSPFTTSLLKHLETPGLEINFLFRNVRDDVIKSTRREQQPFVYGSLSKDAIYFKAPAPIALPTPSGPAPDEMTWSLLKDTSDVGALQRFIAQFPKSALRTEAEKRIAAINAEAAATEAARPKAPAADELVWNLVKDTKDSGQLKLFIEQYPKSARRGEAEKRIAALNAEAAAAAATAAAAAKQPAGPAPDEVVWNLMKDTKDSGQLKLFVQQYPKSARRADAEKRIAALNAEAAKAAASAAAAVAAAAKQPAGPAPDEVVWNLVKDTRDTGQLKLFIDQYPTSARRADAETRLSALNADAAEAAARAAAAADAASKLQAGPAPDEVVWIHVKDTRDSGQLKLFIEQYPKSARRADAEKRLAALNAEAATAAAKAAEAAKAEIAKAAAAAKAEAAKAAEAVAAKRAQSSSEPRAAPAAPSGGGGGGKCFTFNNRRFCE